ncbi:MAG: ABC transporter permease [Bacteroidetes bacterium]|uniref:Transport permease protein n=1 Tax=Candidatus Caccoplasma merdipullorum TaxID=2840718 RepID=A0A9D9E4X1_9BACT|nr:ABC transporter permease [Candidatus Caccoplasma merdipullorum]
MRRFLAFVKKEFFHIFRDRRTMLILIGMPIVEICLFGFALSVEIRNINFAVIDPSPSEATRRITERIAANEYFTYAGELGSEAEIDDAMRRGKADVVLIYGNGIADALHRNGDSEIQITADAANPNAAASEALYLTQILQSELASNNRGAEMPETSAANIRMLYNPQMKSAYNFVPGVMGLLLILICALMTSVSIVREKETGTMETLLVSPVKPVYIIFSKMVPYFTISCFNYITILALAYFVLDVPMAGSIFWLTAASLIYITLALALGLFISTLVEHQATAMVFSVILLMLPVIMLSGMIFPVESMPALLQWASNIVPAKWYISITRKLMVQGVEFRYIIKELAILAGMTAFMIMIALKNLKNRL